MFGPRTRVIDVKPENHQSRLKKAASGDMMVEFHSGQRGVDIKNDRKSSLRRVFGIGRTLTHRPRGRNRQQEKDVKFEIKNRWTSRALITADVP